MTADIITTMATITIITMFLSTIIITGIMTRHNQVITTTTREVLAAAGLMVVVVGIIMDDILGKSF